MGRLIIHPGLPKTGTSALQAFLKQNEQALEARGIGYYAPKNRYDNWEGLSNGDFLLAAVLFEIEKSREKMHESWLHDNSINKNAEWIKEDISSFKEYFSRHDTVILSEEYIWHWEHFYPGFWKTMRDMLNEWLGEGTEIRIVLYLRRQDEWAYSRWKEFVRAKMPCTLSFKGALRAMEKAGFLDFEADISELEGVFGKENITVRNYSRAYLEGGDICRDFLSAAGLDMPDGLVFHTEDHNVSLTNDIAEALRLIKGCPFISQPPVMELYDASTLLSSDARAAGERDLFPLSAAERRRLLGRYERGNGIISKKYNSGAPIFSAEIKEGSWKRRPGRIIKAAKEILRLANK